MLIDRKIKIKFSTGAAPYARREITFPPPEAKKRLLSNSPLTVDMQIVPDEVLVAATTDSILPDEIIPIFTTPEIDTTAETFY